jgi:hypothetical protein
MYDQARIRVYMRFSLSAMIVHQWRSCVKYVTILLSVVSYWGWDIWNSFGSFGGVVLKARKISKYIDDIIIWHHWEIQNIIGQFKSPIGVEFLQ